MSCQSVNQSLFIGANFGPGVIWNLLSGIFKKDSLLSFWLMYFYGVPSIVESATRKKWSNSFLRGDIYLILGMDSCDECLNYVRCFPSHSIISPSATESSTGVLDMEGSQTIGMLFLKL